MTQIQKIKENVAHNRYMIGRILNWHGYAIDYFKEVNERLDALEGSEVRQEKPKPVLIRIK